MPRAIKSTSITVPVTGEPRITPAQLRILARSAEGKSNPEIAEELGMSARTIGNHLASLYRNLNVRNKIEAINKIGGDKIKLDVAALPAKQKKVPASKVPASVDLTTAPPNFLQFRHLLAFEPVRQGAGEIVSRDLALKLWKVVNTTERVSTVTITRDGYPDEYKFGGGDTKTTRAALTALLDALVADPDTRQVLQARNQERAQQKTQQKKQQKGKSTDA